MNIKDTIKQFKNVVNTIVKRMIKMVFTPYYQSVSAELAFFMFLSIVPTLLILSHLLGLFDLTADQFREWLSVILINEGEVGNNILSHLNEAPSGANTIVLAFLALWAASRMEFSLGRMTNRTFSDANYSGKGFIRERTRAIVSTIIILLSVVISLVVMVYGGSFVKIAFSFKNAIAKKIVDTAIYALRWPIALGMYFLMVSLAMYILPSYKIKYTDVLPGGIFSSIAIMLVTMGFNLYTTYIANYNLLYGSFASIIAILVYFWFVAWTIICGIVFTRVYWTVRKKNPIPLRNYDTDITSYTD